MFCSIEADLDDLDDDEPLDEVPEVERACTLRVCVTCDQMNCVRNSQ